MFGKATRGKSDHTKIRGKKYWTPSLLGPWKAHINYNWMNLWKPILWTAPIAIIFEKLSLLISVLWSKRRENVLLKNICIYFPLQTLNFWCSVPVTSFWYVVNHWKLQWKPLFRVCHLLNGFKWGIRIRWIWQFFLRMLFLLGYKTPRPATLVREKWDVGKKG